MQSSRSCFYCSPVNIYLGRASVTALTTKTVRAGGDTHCCRGTRLGFLQTGGVAELFGCHAGDVLEELGEERLRGEVQFLCNLAHVEGR